MHFRAKLTRSHFPGSSVLHWDRLAEPAPPADHLPTKPTMVSGILFTADTIMVMPTQTQFTFVWSVPNMVSLVCASSRSKKSGASVSLSRPKLQLRPRLLLTILTHRSPYVLNKSWPSYAVLRTFLSLKLHQPGQASFCAKTLNGYCKKAP